MSKLILGIWLGIQAGIDFKYKEIPLWSSFIVGAIGVGFCILEGRSLERVIFSLIPGIFSLLFSKITKEVIGYGDGIVLIVMGFFLTLQQLGAVLLTAFGVAGITALVLLVCFKKKGNYRIPFIPFLFIAFLIDCVFGVEGVAL